MRLNRIFFNRDTLTVAKELLGKYLCRSIDGKILMVKITETEAYCGQKDLACHASKGLTPRNKVMFGSPGYAYIYMIYGMYHCLNFVTEKEGNPSAVLIRAADGLRGPGILCRELKINKMLNETDIVTSRELWVEDRGKIIRPRQIKKGKRIGVGYAGAYKNKLWRFYL